jgi:hypothetical protein
MSDETDPKDLPEGSEGPAAEAEDAEDARLRALVKKAVTRSRRSDPPAAEAEAPEGGPAEAATEEEPGAVVDEVDLKDALRGALRPPPGAVAPSLLSGVQRKLRVRSRGKFYGDGWSTAESPKSTYLVTSVIMLVLVALVFLALVPWSSTSLP